MADLVLRPALPEDSEAILIWRNDPVSRSFFKDSNIISRQDHETWYHKSLECVDRFLFIGEIAGDRVGIVRYEPTGIEGEFEVSINLNPEWRNRALGKSLLEESRPILAKNLGFEQLKLRAEIKPGNTASMKTFERAGYIRDQAPSINGLTIFTCSWPDFDAVICLSNAFDADLQLNRELLQRLDLSAQLFKAYGATKLVTLGWAYHTETSVSLAHATADHAQIHHDIAANDIHIEDRPKDTVGEAIYLAIDCLPRYHWKSVAVVTSDWHMPRAKHVFSYIFGNHCQLSWFTIKGAASFQKAEHLNRSRHVFDAMVENIPAGHVDALFAAIKQQHPLYQDI